MIMITITIDPSSSCGTHPQNALYGIPSVGEESFELSPIDDFTIKLTIYHISISE